MTMNFDPVTQIRREIWEWLYSKISSWNTNAPDGNKVKILQYIQALYMYFDPSQTPIGIWCIDVWATRRWTYIAIYFEYFETTQNLDIALYMSARGNNWQMDW